MKQLLRAAVSGFVALDDNMLDMFEQLTAIMLETNRRMNITAITDPVQITLKHYADSLSLLSTGLITSGSRVCDIGCGGGFPGLPLKIVLPDLKLHMIDSTAKKINYIRGAAERLGIKDLELTAGRAELLAVPSSPLRGQYDVAVARAVARLNVLCELCLPFVRVGGYFLAMKGVLAEQEAKESERAINLLGGRLEELHGLHFDLPDFMDDPNVAEFCASERYIIVIKKVRPTPAQCPRAYSVISKKPL